jgi:hypothetical protein
LTGLARKLANPPSPLTLPINPQRVKVCGRIMAGLYASNTAIDYAWYPSWLHARYERPSECVNGPEASLGVLKALWDDTILGIVIFIYLFIFILFYLILFFFRGQNFCDTLPFVFDLTA